LASERGVVGITIIGALVVLGPSEEGYCTDALTRGTLSSKGDAVHGAYVERYFSQDSDRHISIAQFNTEAGYFLIDHLVVATNAYVLRGSGHRVVSWIPSFSLSRGGPRSLVR
jgi:hypothetical protein